MSDHNTETSNKAYTKADNEIFSIVKKFTDDRKANKPFTQKDLDEVVAKVNASNLPEDYKIGFELEVNAFRDDSYDKPVSRPAYRM